MKSFLNQLNLKTCWIFVILCLGQCAFAQNPTTVYLEIAKLKKANEDFLQVQNQIVKPYSQERIKQGNLLAHALFKVDYPNSDSELYDYISMNIYRDFKDVNLEDEKYISIGKDVFPNGNLQEVRDRYEAAAEFAGSEVFVIMDEAIPGPKGGSEVSPRFIKVNHMKVAEGTRSEYLDMETNIFKPLHQNQIKNGEMHDWIVAQRILPYGSDWDNDFLTFDIYNHWEDMIAGNLEADFANIHPEIDGQTIMDKMARTRDLTRSEVWELISYVNTSTPEITYDIIKEGEGAVPTVGQEVIWKGKVRKLDGTLLFNTDVLGFDWYHSIGSDPYDRYLDKGFRQIKKGGIISMTIPLDAQDNFMKSITHHQTARMQVELIDTQPAKPDGSKILEKKINQQGLAAAKEWFKKMQSDNPKRYCFREVHMNSLGYKLMSIGKNEAAVYVFEENQKNNPNSFNSFDSLADGYMAVGLYAKAKRCYEGALKLNPDFQVSKDKLAKL